MSIRIHSITFGADRKKDPKLPDYTLRDLAALFDKKNDRDQLHLRVAEFRGPELPPPPNKRTDGTIPNFFKILSKPSLNKPLDPDHLRGDHSSRDQQAGERDQELPPALRKLMAGLSNEPETFFNLDPDSVKEGCSRSGDKSPFYIKIFNKFPENPKK